MPSSIQRPIGGRYYHSELGCTDNVPSEKTKRKIKSEGLRSCFVDYENPRATRPNLCKQKADWYDLKKQRSSSSANSTSQMNARLVGGVNNSASRKLYNVIPLSKCKYKTPYNSKFDVGEFEIQMDCPSKGAIMSCREKKDQFLLLNKTRGTQTLYRESSAQTLPYLPDIAIKVKNELNKLEIYKLSKILPNLNKPPGSNEVEILERARKRWALAEKVNANLKIRNSTKGDIAPKHICEALEWESWIEREEHMQECQRLRYEIVTQMFNDREKQMLDASNLCLEMASKKNKAKCNAKAFRNKIEYRREVRRLTGQYFKGVRNWRKENIITAFGDPSSDYFAPQMRYGVNPGRRHFTSARKAFDKHIKSLENQSTNFMRLQCPLTNLKKWSKPKEYLISVERNFCKDTNLMKLYEALKELREQSTKAKDSPKCLIRRVEQQSTLELSFMELNPEEQQIMVDTANIELDSTRQMELEKCRGYEERHRKTLRENRRREFFLRERREEDMEMVINSFESSTLGWVVRFLSEEMDRLIEQRRLKFLTMLSHKERFHREAAEAGLRQKETEIRKFFESIYELTNCVNKESASHYVNNILDFEAEAYGEDIARDNILELSKLIDDDLQVWVDHIKKVQNPLNYSLLRCMLCDLAYPDATRLAQQYEIQSIVLDIVGELFRDIMKQLEPYDIVSFITDEVVSRAIEDDVHILSTDSEPESGDKYSTAQLEAKAILRKVIRRAVPGRRWKTEEEQLCATNVRSIFEEIFDEMEVHTKSIRKQQSEFDLTSDLRYINFVDSTSENERVTRITILDRKSPLKSNTRVSLYEPQNVKSIPSTINIFDKKVCPEKSVRWSSTELSNIGVIFDMANMNECELIRQFVDDLLDEVVENATVVGVNTGWINEKTAYEITPVDSIETFIYDISTEEIEIFDSGEDDIYVKGYIVPDDKGQISSDKQKSFVSQEDLMSTFKHVCNHTVLGGLEHGTDGQTLYNDIQLEYIRQNSDVNDYIPQENSVTNDNVVQREDLTPEHSQDYTIVQVEALVSEDKTNEEYEDFGRAEELEECVASTSDMCCPNITEVLSREPNSGRQSYQ